MVRRKGERTNKHREAEYVYAVDVPVGGRGLGQNLIHADVARAGGEVWSHSDLLGERRTPRDFARCGFRSADQADAFAETWRLLGATRVR